MLLHTNIIRQVPLFSTLPEEELAALAASLREVDFPAHTVLFEEGECGDRFYIIVEGGVAIFKAMGNGEERVFGIRGPGEFVGEMSLLNRDGRRTASVRVEKDARLLEMTRAEFDDLLHRQPTIAYEMLRVLSSRLGETNNKTIRDLTEKNRLLSEAYANLQAAQEQIIQKEVLDRELLRARKIQQSMLPRALPHLEGLELGAKMVPAQMVGGDFYDFIPLGPDTLGVAVGDVSGKGVPAALFMAMSRTILRSEARANAPPDQVLHQVNKQLLGLNDEGMFVTLLYGIFHGKSGEFTYCRAAHEYPLIWNGDGEVVKAKEDRGMPLGLFSMPFLEVQTIHLPAKSTLLIISDGITEAANEEGNFFGEEGIYAAVPACRRNSAQELCESLVQQLETYRGKAPQSDDITLVALRRI